MPRSQDGGLLRGHPSILPPKERRSTTFPRTLGDLCGSNITLKCDTLVCTGSEVAWNEYSVLWIPVPTSPPLTHASASIYVQTRRSTKAFKTIQGPQAILGPEPGWHWSPPAAPLTRPKVREGLHRPLHLSTMIHILLRTCMHVCLCVSLCMCVVCGGLYSIFVLYVLRVIMHELNMSQGSVEHTAFAPSYPRKAMVLGSGTCLQQMQGPVAAAIEKPRSPMPDPARGNGSIGVLGFVTDRAASGATAMASNLLHENESSAPVHTFCTALPRSRQCDSALLSDIDSQTKKIGVQQC